MVYGNWREKKKEKKSTIFAPTEHAAMPVSDIDVRSNRDVSPFDSDFQFVDTRKSTELKRQ